MNQTQLFEVLLDVIRELSGFAPYVYAAQGDNSRKIRSKLRAVGERMIIAADDEEL